MVPDRSRPVVLGISPLAAAMVATRIGAGTSGKPTPPMTEDLLPEPDSMGSSAPEYLPPGTRLIPIRSRFYILSN
jgi:hypothetical protein